MKKFVLFCLLVTVTFGFADDTKISPELRGYNSSQPVQVIVQYAPGTQPGAQSANQNCGGLLGLVGCLVSDVLNIVEQLPLVNGVVALLDGTGIVNLSNQPNVVYISSDRQLSTLDNAPSAVNAQVAWQSNYVGNGIGVALIDSGVNSHPDLYTGILPISRVVYNQSFVSGTSSTADQYGHGTHIAGLIAGDGLASPKHSWELRREPRSSICEC
jgi:serine protease AprX